MNRRAFLKLSTGAALLPLPGPALAADAGPRRLIVVLLRGAVDGLSIVVPYGDKAYAEHRPTLAVPRPGATDGGLALDADFALHPSLGALMPLWAERQLAFIHAAGSPDPTRSHFDAQRYIETGTPGQDRTPDGWMNRLLAAMPPPHGPTEAIALGATVPRILWGRMAVANVARRGGAGGRLPFDEPAVAAAFDRLYAGDDPLGRAYREGRAARAQLTADLEGADKNADGGAPPAYGTPAEMARLARLIAADPTIRLAFADYGGWDTHVNQKGPLAARLKALGTGLDTLAKGLGPLWADTVVVVLSEFGRTVAENGDHGTDHGHGNAIWLLGGAVAGGKVYGEWPGLAPDKLYQRRDLAVTTDFRCALAAILERHLRLDDKALAAVFPALPASPPDLRKMLTA
jgi:uncharacterized protein (DUF1501 family)